VDRTACPPPNTITSKDDRVSLLRGEFCLACSVIVMWSFIEFQKVQKKRLKYGLSIKVSGWLQVEPKKILKVI